MITLGFSQILVLIIGGLFAGIVDTIIGGGGLFSIPTLFLVGAPAQVVLGTNQFALSMGSLIGTVKFSQKGYMRWWPETLICIIGTLPGTILGGITAIRIPPEILQFIIISLLIVIGVIVLLKTNFGNKEVTGKGHLTITRAMIIFVLGLFFGFYEGFFGPGSGLLIIFSFALWFGFSLLQASGSAKAISLVGNITAFIVFAIHGSVLWIAGLIMGISVIIGAYIGVYFAQYGSKIIRPVMLTVIVLLIGRLLFSIF